METDYFFGPQEVATLRKASRLIDAIADAHQAKDLEQIGALLKKEGIV